MNLLEKYLIKWPGNMNKKSRNPKLVLGGLIKSLKNKGVLFQKRRSSFLPFIFFLASVWTTPQAEPSTNIPTQAWSRDINAGGYPDGAPIGGFGAGTNTWEFNGDFYQMRLNLADCTAQSSSPPNWPLDANCNFYLYQKSSGQAAVMKKLDAAALGSNEAIFYSLYPKSWVAYTGTVFPCPATVTQFTPLIPNDYQRSSYPEGIYEWDLTNPATVSCDVAVMLTWDNNFGGNAAAVSTSGNNIGLVLTRTGGSAVTSTQGEFTLAAQGGGGVTVTYQSDTSASNLQASFSTAGLLNNTVGSNNLGAIAFKSTLAPGQEIKVPLVLTWDIPICQAWMNGSPNGLMWYRYYTNTYGTSGLNSFAIANDALNNYPSWESAIDNWQISILSGPYPNWLKQMLFNELYYYVTGGTLWEASVVPGQTFNGQTLTASSFDKGMFSSLESYIYALYGTSDVRFYGSWPLALLWPQIDKQEVMQFCDSVAQTPDGTLKPAAIGTCAHDYGANDGTQFTKWNSYTYRDTTQWKDLNSKLVLTVWRYYYLTGQTDTAFLNYCWPAVQAAMNYVHNQCDSSGLPLNTATSYDCTYDDMGLNGNSSYCGSLFLAACEAVQQIALKEGNSALANTYQSWLTKGQASFQSLLWNTTSVGGENYYNIDTTSGSPARIMNDQLCGQWYAQALGLPSIVADAQAKKAWQTVHDYNWSKFDSGAHGAVNVMTPGGQIDTSYGQSQEMWVGTAWGAVAGMIQEGMLTQGLDIGQSLYNSIWGAGGGQYWFRTPEAWQTGLSNMRAPYYMRANCIWAVKHAYDVNAAMTASPTPSPTPTATSTFTPTATDTPCLVGGTPCTSTPTITATWTATPTPTPLPNGVPLLYPNPAKGVSAVTFLVPLTAPSDVKVQLFSTAFRKVQDLTFHQVVPGTPLSLALADHWNTALANGLYYVAVKAAGKSWTLKMIVLQ